MNQEKLNTDLSTLEKKIRLLVGEHKKLKEELGFLKDENSKLKSDIKSKNEYIRNFQNKINISKLVDRIAVDEDSDELKKTIDNYLREIDKCIAYLSR